MTIDECLERLRDESEVWQDGSLAHEVFTDAIALLEAGDLVGAINDVDVKRGNPRITWPQSRACADAYDILLMVES